MTNTTKLHLCIYSSIVVALSPESKLQMKIGKFLAFHISLMSTEQEDKMNLASVLNDTLYLIQGKRHLHECVIDGIINGINDGTMMAPSVSDTRAGHLRLGLHAEFVPKEWKNMQLGEYYWQPRLSSVFLKVKGDKYEILQQCEKASHVFENHMNLHYEKFCANARKHKHKANM